MKPEAFLKKQNYYRAGRCRNASDSGYNKKEISYTNLISLLRIWKNVEIRKILAYNVERILRIKRKVVLYIMERRNAWLSYEEADEKELEKLAKNYRTFLDAGKTERECVLELTREAEAAGYVSLENKLASGEQIKAGDKIYAVGMKKIMAMFHIGQEPIEKGMNILGAHIDSPRLDVKQNPLYDSIYHSGRDPVGQYSGRIRTLRNISVQSYGDVVWCIQRDHHALYLPGNQKRNVSSECSHTGRSSRDAGLFQNLCIF